MENPELTGRELPSKNMAPMIGVGGLLSVKTQWHYYSALLGGSSDTQLNAKDRFLPIPDKGLSNFPEMYGQLEEQLVETHQRLEERTVMFGHSLGALMATMLAIEHPDKVSGVICLAGVQDGVTTETWAGTILRLGLRNPPGAEDLKAESDFMQSHKKNMATRWSPNTSLHLISPTYDQLIPSPQGLGVILPSGQSPEKRYVVPSGLPKFIAQRLLRMPASAEPLRGISVEHVTIALSPSVIRYSREVRRAAANCTESVHNITDSYSESQLLAAA